MVLLKKTNSRMRRIWGGVGNVTLVALGFFLVLFATDENSNHSNALQSHEALSGSSVAYADAAACGCVGGDCGGATGGGSASGSGSGDASGGGGGDCCGCGSGGASGGGAY